MLQDRRAFERSAVATHHWLVRRRGGERVFEALLDLVPRADVYTLIHDRSGYQLPRKPSGEARTIHQSLLRFVPKAARHYDRLLPLLPLAASSVRLPAVDLVLCSDAAIAKAMRVHSRSKLVCYCHSPMRYAWDLADEYAASVPAALRPLWPALVRYLRRTDYAAAQRVDVFVANSRYVADRIRRNYDRDSHVVYPPVDLPAAPVISPREHFYLCVGRHVPYKRLDLAIDACKRLGRRLLVIGETPGHPRRSATQPLDPAGIRALMHRLSVDQPAFLGWQPDETVYECYTRARALLFCGIEDFGIVPVEAMARGCPVIAFGVGGARETVREGQTGVFFNEQSVDAVCAAILGREKLEFDPAGMLSYCQRFGGERFRCEMSRLLETALAGPAAVS